MHVLIIGGTGLISTAITRQLLEAGHEVTLFNRGKTPSRLPQGANIMHGDRKEYSEFESTFSNQTFDVVVDMVSFLPEDAASAIRAFNERCAQFIHCSTVCVYSGPVTRMPTLETEPYHSIGDYGKNKILCEKTLLRAWEEDQFPVTIMRPSHSYGEGGVLTRSFGPRGSFVQRIRDGQPLIVHGDGTSLWASCHVDDVARGFIAAMGVEKCLGEAYHITGEEWMTWNNYYEQVAEIVGGNYCPVFIPTDVLLQVAPKWARGTYEIFSWPSVFDNSKLQRDTEYSGQTISWKEGAARNIQWMDAQPQEDDDPNNDEDRLIAAWREQNEALPRIQSAN